MIETISMLAEIISLFAVIGGVLAISILVWAISTDRNDE